MYLKNKFQAIFNSDNRVLGLDIIRAFAIVRVLWGHAIILVPEELKGIASIYKYFYIEGVSIFFVLSGFLITKIILRDFSKISFLKFKDYLNFWKRRWYRTIPAYFFVLLILLLIDFQNWNYRFSFFFFASNLTEPLKNGFFTVSWSLAVEEWYYLIFPLLLAALLFFTSLKKGSLLTLLLIIVFVNILRFNVLNNDGPNTIYNIRQVVIYRLDGIALGGVLAWVYFYYPIIFNSLKKPFIYILIGLLFLFPVIYDLNYIGKELMIFNYESLIAFLIIPFLSSFTPKFKTRIGELFQKTITGVSKISYSIYLVHASIVLWYIVRIMQKHEVLAFLRYEFQQLTYFLIYISLTIIISLILYFYIEEPFMRIRNKRTKG